MKLAARRGRRRAAAAAVHALGSFPGDASRAALAAAPATPWRTCAGTPRSRWPAGAILAAAPVLLQMMDRAHLASVADLSPDQADEAVLQAVPAAAVVPDPALRAALRALSDGDPNLKVRQAARAALENSLSPRFLTASGGPG